MSKNIIQNREDMSIWKDIKRILNPNCLDIEICDCCTPKPRTRMDSFRKLINKISLLFSIKYSDSWNNAMVIRDSFKMPYYRWIGCKIFGHNMSKEEYGYEKLRICWNCSECFNPSDIRNVKIDQIVKNN